MSDNLTSQTEPQQLSNPDSWSADHVLNAQGLYCPEPVMMLHNKIRDIQVDETMKLIATDPSTTRDVPKFCVYLQHELLQEQKVDNLYFYLIRKSQ